MGPRARSHGLSNLAAPRLPQLASGPIFAPPPTNEGATPCPTPAWYRSRAGAPPASPADAGPGASRTAVSTLCRPPHRQRVLIHRLRCRALHPVAQIPRRPPRSSVVAAQAAAAAAVSPLPPGAEPLCCTPLGYAALPPRPRHGAWNEPRHGAVLRSRQGQCDAAHTRPRPYGARLGAPPCSRPCCSALARSRYLRLPSCSRR